MFAVGADVLPTVLKIFVIPKSFNTLNLIRAPINGWVNISQKVLLIGY
jgi:hypothetical protein